MNRVRYCYECGHVGEVGPTFISCCPDGGHALMVPQAIADQARIGFLVKLALVRHEHPRGVVPCT